MWTALAGTRGLSLADAARRFWFTPENMRFAAQDGAVLFRGGRIVLKTAIVGSDASTPADRAFARFFTDQYDVIAARYPIFNQLERYARLVSLARYLKQQGVPMQGFLFAHRDKLLTELSTETVDTLSRGSRYFDNVLIEGGVDLHGRYLVDGEHPGAAAAIETSVDSTHDAVPPPLNVLPVQSMRAASPDRGYLTDLAVRRGGQPGLELVRHRLPASEGDFANGWHLLVPLRARAVGDATESFLNAMIPRQWRIEDPLTGSQETLTFDTEKYALNGYRPSDLAVSRYIGMFWTTDARLRLVDKIGNEFWLDAGGVLQEMRLGNNFVVRFERRFEESAAFAFDQPPYRLEAEGRERTTDLNVPLPRRLRITRSADGEQMSYLYGSRNGLLGYRRTGGPAGADDFIALRRDGTFAWIDASGNEHWFDLNFNFLRFRQPLVSALVQGRYVSNENEQTLRFVEDTRIRFTHSFAARRFTIHQAALFDAVSDVPVQIVDYDVDADGRLTATTSAVPAERRVFARSQPGTCGPGWQGPDGIASAARRDLTEPHSGRSLC